MTTLNWPGTAASSLNDSERWYATETPVIPEPTMQTSASAVRGPVLPSRARGFTPGAESVQNECVGLGTGSDADSKGGEKIAWNGACNECKGISAETCMTTRTRANNGWTRRSVSWFYVLSQKRPTET